MHKRSAFRLVCSARAVIFLSLCGSTIYAATGPVTIIDTPTGCDTVNTVQERNNLAAALTAAGNTVTTITTGVVPGSLAGEIQVWDIRCTTDLTAGEITTYTTYLQGGGSLFVMGENVSFGASRDNSILTFIAGLGGGTLTLTSSANSQTAQPPFTGPNALTTVTFRAIGGTTTSGTGAFGTKDTSNFGGVLAFGPGSLSGAAAGTLIIVFDVNFLDNAHTASEIALTNNLIAYLAAPVPIVGVPAPPTLILTLMGMLAAGALALRRRTRVVA